MNGEPVFWHEAEPGRHERDLEEISAFSPDLAFTAGPGEDLAGLPHHGVWVGRLPVWPFDRPAPAGLDGLVPQGLVCAVWYSAAHPVLPPRIQPLDPKPEIVERSQHTWHVAPDSTLCLMQSLGSWEPETSVVDLLEKACGWRIEYALMKAGVITEMTLCGIVNDDSLDSLITKAAAEAAQAAGTLEPTSDFEEQL